MIEFGRVFVAACARSASCLLWLDSIQLVPLTVSLIWRALVGRATAFWLDLAAIRADYGPLLVWQVQSAQSNDFSAHN